jgi:hypothetical protein
MFRGIRSSLAAGLGPVLTAGGMALPPAAVAAAAVAGAAAVAAAVAAAPVAKAATPSGNALVLLQNGETTAPETTALRAAGWTVDQATPAQWLADSAATFKSYAVRPDEQRHLLHLRRRLHRQPAAVQRPAHHHQPERPCG